ncbi:TetR/AcrR family transcriptional regulator [Ktedonobacter racemifer]|uniref:Transcriptional regulator, TetR family n=1 Tax=Ktedonobacter racemifer DSM 44963 TaxID=485913 RepID=D6TNZ8_KTERA|nr:TetR/AcrR family transcriptional regulator [Ktedonobacter racemifer]EFH85534.1 transcriptional regulator, TetR family [Ktedonobacter racemifer DSM 44963]
MRESTLSLKERQRQQREQLILHASEKILLEKGYHEMCMDEVAARVGIAKGTLYLHFSRKEDLVLALLELQMQAILQNVQEAVSAPGSVRSRLETLLATSYMRLKGERGRLFYALFGAVELRPLLRSRHHALLDQLLSSLEVLLNEGKASGEFDPAIPTTIMLHTFSSLLASYPFKRLLLDEMVTPEELVQYVGKIFFRGVANPQRAYVESLA